MKKSPKQPSDTPPVIERRNRVEMEAEANTRSSGILVEYWEFLKHNKKWWLLPILVVLALLGLIVILGGSGVAPFIYRVF